MPTRTTTDIEHHRAPRQAEPANDAVQLIGSPRVTAEIQRGTELLLDPRKLPIPVLGDPRHVVIITDPSTGITALRTGTPSAHTVTFAMRETGARPGPIYGPLDGFTMRRATCGKVVRVLPDGIVNGGWFMPVLSGRTARWRSAARAGGESGR